MEDTLMSYANTGMPRDEELLLQLRQTTSDFHDVILGTLVDLRIRVLDEVKDVHRQSAVPCSDLINDEILVREVFEEVLRYQALSDGLPIVRLCARVTTWVVGCETYHAP